MAIEDFDQVTIAPAKLRPFSKFIMSIGELPTSYLDSLSYAEQITWFCDYLQNRVIPALNNNAEALEEVQNLMTQLQEYVDNYFTNLDVQEEINNKLDDMVEQGTLQEIIADYLNSKAVFGYDTVADMKAATNLIDGSYAKTLGYHTKNDNGMATYKIRKITNDDTVDEMTIISLNDETLIAELIITDIMNIECFGAYGDNTHDDSNSIEKAVNLGLTVLFSNKSYKCNKQITITKACKLLGTSSTRETNRYYIDFSDSTDNECFIFNVKGIIFENINIKGNRDSSIGITLINTSRFTFKNCGFYYLNKAIYTNRAWSTSFYDCVFEYCNTCVEFNGINTSFLFNGTIFYSSTNGIVSNQELDYSNIVGGGFDHVDTCINLVSTSYANNITLLNCGFEDYITGIIALGNSQTTVISCTFVNTERTVETYKGAGKILVINGRSDTALTPNKSDVIYISPILPSNANIANAITSYNNKVYNQINNTKFYDFIWPVSNGTYIDLNYESNTQFDVEIDISSTDYPETVHFTKYSTSIAKTQGDYSSFTWINDTTNNRVRITFNTVANIRVKGFMKYSGNIS